MYLQRTDAGICGPKTVDEEKDNHTAKGGTDGADQTSFYNAESIACCDLKRTTRNDGGKDLQDQHTKKEENADKTLCIYPCLKGSRSDTKATSGLSHVVVITKNNIIASMEKNLCTCFFMMPPI